MAEEEYKIKWSAPEYIRGEKSSDWYWILAIIGLALIIISIIMDNYLFAILLLISFFAVVLHSHKEPSVLECEINKNGITLGKELMPYPTLESFRVEKENSLPPKLLIKSHKFFTPLIAVYITDADPDEISNYLTYFLPEEDLHEPLSHHIMEYFGF